MTDTKAENVTKNTAVISMISPDSLFPNPSQPRFIFEDEPLLRLADSIKRYGVLQPLSVRAAANNTYQIIAGERRWRAARIAGLDKLPCVILNVNSQKSAEIALIENIQREDLNIFEQAAAIASLIDVYGLTQEQAAKQLSSSQSHVANKLRILKLTPKERTEILKHKLTERHARALLRLNDPNLRLEVIAHVAANELNVSATDKYIDSLVANKKEARRKQQIKGCLKDLKIFHNAIDRSTELLRTCGYDVKTEKSITETETIFIIRIPLTKTP